MDNHNKHKDSGTVAETRFHVHFSEDTDEIGHTQINIKKRSEFNYEVHVGFLQVYHKYKIIICLPIDNDKKDYALSNKVQSICVKALNIEAKNDKRLEISVEFFAYKEKLLKEKLVLNDSENKEVILTIFARVLGKGKGTPMLREGVTCIGVQPVEDDSEFSDWQGFD